MSSRDNVCRDVTFTFPIVGHSYLPPDRVFGRIEKEIRQHEEITGPEGYRKIYENHGKVKVFPTNWQVCNYKTPASLALQKVEQLKMRESRVWKFKKNSTEMTIEHNYEGFASKTYQLVKEIVPLLHNPKLVKLTSHISVKKLADVESLLANMNLTESEKAFYAIPSK